MLAPPKRCCSKSNSPTALRTSSAGAISSGPMPSPGRVTTRWAIEGERYTAAAALALDRRFSCRPPVSGRPARLCALACHRPFAAAAGMGGAAPGRTPLKSRRHRTAALALALVGVDLDGLAQRDRDVVEPLEQSPSDLGVDVEAHGDELAVLAGVAHLLGAQVDQALSCARERPAVRLRQHDREPPDRGALGVGVVSEAWPDDRLEAIVLKAPRSVPAR